MNILVTGANGFVGKNVCVHLSYYEHINILKYDIGTDSKLIDLLELADCIIHLAGVNRPKSPEEFWSGNSELTKVIVEGLQKLKKNTPIIFSSSIQAPLENEYGKSKLAAENLLFEYAKNNNAKAFVYRLSNVFGKWCRPNYNSVVATFCHKVANNEEILINNSKSEIELNYIDDIVDSIIDTAINFNTLDTGFKDVSPKYKTTVGELAEKIYAINDIKHSLTIPDQSDEFTRKLQSTYLTYLPQEKLEHPLHLYKDNRGELFELLKSPAIGQIFVSSTKPGITRGNHYHHTKIEKFVVVKGQAKIEFRNIINDNYFSFDVCGETPSVVDIPPGNTHAITNTGDSDLVTIFWANEIFNADKPDTKFLEVAKK